MKWSAAWPGSDKPHRLFGIFYPYWKVREQVNGQWSEWSKVRTFNVDKAKKKPAVSQEEYEKRLSKEFADVYFIFRGEAARPGQLPSHDDVSRVLNAIPFRLDVQAPDGRL